MKRFTLGVLVLSAGLWAQNVDLVGPAPDELTSISPKIIDLSDLAKRWVATIAKINATISLGIDLGIDDQDPDVVLADGVFGEEIHYCDREFYDFDDSKEKPGYQECRDAWYGKYDGDKEEYEGSSFGAFMHQVYASSTLREITYAWLKPVFQDTFGTVELERKKVLCDIIRHGSDYALDLQDPKLYACESKYAAAEQARVEATRETEKHYSVFHWHRPNQTCDGPQAYDPKSPPFRKLEAWMFRRVRDKHMTAKEIREWMIRLHSEIFNCNA